MASGLYTKVALRKVVGSAELAENRFELLSEKVGDKADTFPCIPGRQGFLTDQLRISFAGDPREEGTPEEVGMLLSEYGKISRNTGRYASLLVILIRLRI